MEIRIEQILANPQQPRTEFDETGIEALAQTMEQDGLLNPIAVTGPHKNGGEREWFVLVDGERRWRAARRLGWETIEAHVQDGEPEGQDRLVRAMIGNLQRSDMGVVDEARAYAQLRESMSVEEISRRVGLSTATIYLRLKLLSGELTDEVLGLLNQGRIPNDSGALQALRKLPDEQQVQVAHRAALQGSSGSTIKSMCSRLLRSNPLQSRSALKRSSQPGKTIAPAFLVARVELGEEHADVVEAVILVCDGCGLDSINNGSVCRDCPLIALVKRMAEMEEVCRGADE